MKQFVTELREWGSATQITLIMVSMIGLVIIYGAAALTLLQAVTK